MNKQDKKSAEAFRTISEAAKDLELAPHVLRFWESKFSQIKPLKRGGNRRYYRPEDILLLRAIRQLLHGEGYTIKGVQKLLKEQGAKQIIDGISGPESGEAFDLAEGALLASSPAEEARRQKARAGQVDLLNEIKKQALRIEAPLQSRLEEKDEASRQNSLSATGPGLKNDANKTVDLGAKILPLRAYWANQALTETKAALLKARASADSAAEITTTLSDKIDTQASRYQSALEGKDIKIKKPLNRAALSKLLIELKELRARFDEGSPS